MNKGNVLVTGGAGYIGSHACKMLLHAGFNPVTFDNLSRGWKQAVKFGPFEFGDLLNKPDIDRVLVKYKPVAIMHFAALSEVGESLTNPGLYWQNNLMGSLNLIQSAIDHDCMNFVFSSTCATYGEWDNILLNEDCERRPVSAYGGSKCAVENIMQDFEKAFGLNYVVFRYFNVAGADPDAEVGELHIPETHLIPLVLEVADGRRDAITIFGTDYDTPDGSCIRDYVHVCDIVEAHILGLNWLLEGNESRIYNLGTGNGFSVKDVIDHVKNITSKEVPTIEGERRPGDCTKLVSGSTRALKELGWSFGRSTLNQMITDAWRWHKKGGYTE